MCGSLLVRYWQNISVLIRASRCAGWQGRPELEQAAGIRVTGMGFLLPKLPDCRWQRGSTSTGLSLEISLGLAPTSAFLAIALFLKHYPCGIHPSFFFPLSFQKMHQQRVHLAGHCESNRVGCFCIRLCKGTPKVCPPLREKSPNADRTEITVNSGEQDLLSPGMTHSV